jgi:hypothetical protein
MSESGHSATENDVRSDGSFPSKRSPGAATVARPATSTAICYWWRKLLELRTLGPATLVSATGQLLPFTALSKAREMM